MDLVIVIPACNEQDTIGEVLASLPTSISGVNRITVMVIDDGSSDLTASIARDANALVVEHGRNLGLASAFRTAVQSALENGADIAVTMDADRQFYPDDIPALLEPILSGRADFVAGNRFLGNKRPGGMPKAKYVGNRAMTYAVNRLTGSEFDDVSSGYRAYSREALLNLNVQSSFTYTQETFIELAAKGIRIEQVPIRVRYFSERRSYISSNLIRYGLRTFLTIVRAARDYAPFSMFGTCAAFFLAPGIALGIFVFAHYILYGSFTPYVFVALMATYLFSLGLALFFIALAADMLRGLRTNQERILYFHKTEVYTDATQTGGLRGQRAIKQWGDGS